LHLRPPPAQGATMPVWSPEQQTTALTEIPEGVSSGGVGHCSRCVLSVGAGGGAGCLLLRRGGPGWPAADPIPRSQCGVSASSSPPCLVRACLPRIVYARTRRGCAHRKEGGVGELPRSLHQTVRGQGATCLRSGEALRGSQCGYCVLCESWSRLALLS